MCTWHVTSITLGIGGTIFLIEATLSVINLLIEGLLNKPIIRSKGDEYEKIKCSVLSNITDNVRL